MLSPLRDAVGFGVLDEPQNLSVSLRADTSLKLREADRLKYFMERMFLLENIMMIFTTIMRYVLPITALIVVLTCVVSLFRNRPRIHKMAQLTDKNNGSVTDINHWETSIGKSRSNDIVLPVPTVSRFHAVIAKKRSEWMITDTFSKTGIRVNGKKVEGKAALNDGDVIEIGDIPLVFECAEALSSQTKKEIRNQARGTAKVVAYAVLVDTKTHKPVYIKKKDVLIGREDNCDIQLLSNTVSSKHARIHLTSRGWALSDLDSHNGTKLNGRYINQPQLIFDEDMITFGDKVFVFYEK